MDDNLYCFKMSRAILKSFLKQNLITLDEYDKVIKDLREVYKISELV